MNLNHKLTFDSDIAVQKQTSYVNINTFDLADLCSFLRQQAFLKMF